MEIGEANEFKLLYLKLGEQHQSTMMGVWPLHVPVRNFSFIFSNLSTTQNTTLYNTYIVYLIYKAASRLGFIVAFSSKCQIYPYFGRPNEFAS